MVERPVPDGEGTPHHQETRVIEPECPSEADFVLCCPHCHQSIPFDEQASHQFLLPRMRQLFSG
jgi:hypothetical protein